MIKNGKASASSIKITFICGYKKIIINPTIPKPLEGA